MFPSSQSNPEMCIPSMDWGNTLDYPAACVKDVSQGVLISARRSSLSRHREAARRLGLMLVERPVPSAEQAKAAIIGARRGAVDGFFSPRLPALNIPGIMLEIGASEGFATMFYSAFFADRGTLASYVAAQTSWGASHTLPGRIRLRPRPVGGLVPALSRADRCPLGPWPPGHHRVG